MRIASGAIGIILTAGLFGIDYSLGMISVAGAGLLASHAIGAFVIASIRI